jgi:hypothetical protein
MVDTNAERAVAIRSPFFVDTNNAAPKLANLVVDLADTKENGRLGGVQLGMTMEQVVARWGKPKGIWSKCYGGPLFCYTDVNVVFESSSNSVLKVFFLGKSASSPIFLGGLLASSSASDFARVLGAPSSREEREDTGSSQLVYKTHAATLRLQFTDDTLSWLRLEQPSWQGHLNK